MYEILLAEVIGLILGIYLIYAVNKNILTNKLLDAERRLRARMSKFESNYGQISDSPQDFIGGALGELGLDGIIKQLGVDPKILNNPLVKGLIEKYAPRILESMQKGGGNDQNKGLL